MGDYGRLFYCITLVRIGAAFYDGRPRSFYFRSTHFADEGRGCTRKLRRGVAGHVGCTLTRLGRTS